MSLFSRANRKATDPRGQPVYGRNAHIPHVSIANHDVRDEKDDPPHRRARHLHENEIYPQCCERLGRPPQSRDRQRLLTVSHPRLPLLRQANVTPNHRPLRILLKQAAPALQRQVERREGGGGGLHPPSRSIMATGNQLVQPTVVPPRRPHSETTTIRCGGHSPRPQMATLPVIRPPLRDDLQDGLDAILK